MFIAPFDSSASIELATVGGKGANLGRLTQAGFVVPAGFTVTTLSYAEFIRESGLDNRIEEMLRGLHPLDADDLDARTGRLRDAITTTALPDEIAKSVVEAYVALGGEPYVAVRSSATAEDLPGTSYAGLHDTFLEIRGEEAVLDAVKRCWASLWTARATSYRHTQGIDQAAVRIAVVVQTMVDAEVAGVMFTGNPLTSATDETVINSNWGLGESVVSGIVTPDAYVVKSGTTKIIERTLGSKALWIHRDPDSSHGTLTEEVEAADRERFTLTDEQISELVQLGRSVEEYYEGFPQDIEWAMCGGKFFLLQAREITGVEFSWDADVDLWHTVEEDVDAFWTRSMADEAWSGPITPLMYSWRAPSWIAGHKPAAHLWGHDDLANTRYWKFYKAEAYYNCAVEKLYIERTMPPPLRPFASSAFDKLPPAWRQPTLDAPFSYLSYLKMYLRMETLQPQIIGGFTKHEDYINNRVQEACGLSDVELRALSDGELKRFIDKQIAFEDEYNYSQWTWFLVCARDGFGILAYIMNNWYDGGDDSAFEALVSGAPVRTATLEANQEMWELAGLIRESDALRTVFRDHPGAAFFAACNELPEGEEFLARYSNFLEAYGHRGHADRDIIFPRRVEDPSIDYNGLAPMVTGDAVPNPADREDEVNARREAAVDHVLDNLRRKPLGFVRAELFKLVHAYVLRFIMARDNERHFIDYSTFSIRRGVREINRRLVERGLADSDRDVFFLSRQELFDYFDGRANVRLTRAKIAARMRDFDRFEAKERPMPSYLHRGQELEFDAVEHDGPNLRGVGTARGIVTGTARLAARISEIGRVRQGEILVVNATDPGWTPVFNVISGIVLETGGLIAHGSCLAREYGLPAVQLPNALKLIPDGATISINGQTGEVRIIDEDEV